MSFLLTQNSISVLERMGVGSFAFRTIKRECDNEEIHIDLESDVDDLSPLVAIFPHIRKLSLGINENLNLDLRPLLELSGLKELKIETRFPSNNRVPLLHLNLISSRLEALSVYDLSIGPTLPAEWCAVETEAARKISCQGGITSYEISAVYGSNILDLDGGRRREHDCARAF